MSELISVIIPTYNRASSIERCICSVLEQKYDNIEILICDDFSKDNTIEIVNKMQERYNNIKILQRDDGIKGANAARNYGIINAKGKYILFLDSDDILVENSISSRIEIFHNDGEIDMVYGDAAYKNGVTHFDYIQKYRNPQKYMLSEMALCPFSVIFVKKDVFLDIPLLENNLLSWQDDDFVMSLVMNGKKLFHCGSTVCRMYVGEGETNISSNYFKKLQGCVFLVTKYKEKIREESKIRFFLWKMRILRDECIVNSQKSNSVIVSFAYRVIFHIMTVLLKPFFYNIWG